MNRRHFLQGGAALAAAGKAMSQSSERYKLGCWAAMYRRLPLGEALERIRKAGYGYIIPTPKHADEDVFSPEMPGPARAAMLRRMRDAGVRPCLSLGGFSGALETEKGLPAYLAQLDLCRDFEIPVMVGGGPWYYQKFPNLPKRAAEWEADVSRFYAGLEKAVRHAESIGVTIALKPHTGITANAKACSQVVKRIVSDRLKICWDAGNVAFYEGINPDPDLPELAPQIRAVCIKDHQGFRAEANFPIPGQGQVDHELLFRTLIRAGFNGPMAVEKLDGRGEAANQTPEAVDARLAAARAYLVSVLDRVTGAA